MKIQSVNKSWWEDEFMEEPMFYHIIQQLNIVHCLLHDVFQGQKLLNFQISIILFLYIVTKSDQSILLTNSHCDCCIKTISFLHNVGVVPGYSSYMELKAIFILPLKHICYREVRGTKTRPVRCVWIIYHLKSLCLKQC